MYGEIATALTSLSTASRLLSGFLESINDAKLKVEVSKILSALVEAQAHAVAAQDQITAHQQRITELQQENSRYKDWSAERENYELREIAVGVFAYINKDSVKPFESASKLCCYCFDHMNKSVLQQHPSERRFITLKCHNKCPDLMFDYYKELNE